MIGRALWVLFILGIAIVTAGIQLDRQSRYVPTFAASVPEPLRAFSQRHAVKAALEGGDDQLALEEARKLVARRPMPAEHLRLLSLAEFEAGQIAEGSYSIQLAARRGWRDRPAQRTMLELALGVGDQAEAARRYAALFVRQSETDAELRELAQKVFAPGTDEARSVFAQIVAGAQRWHRIYLRKGPAVIPPEAFTEITVRASEAEANFDCEALESARERLSRRDEAAGIAFNQILEGC